MRHIAVLLAAAGLTACSEPTTEPQQISPQQPATETPAAPQGVANEDQNIEITLGSAVKRLCSSVLVGGRSIEHVMAYELGNPALEAVDFSFDDDLVTATGMGQTVSALYREQLGCTLVKDSTPEQLRAPIPDF